MARWFAAGVLAGMVITTVVGAAVGIHAMSEAGDGGSADEDQPAVETALAAESSPTPEPAYGIFDRLAQCEASGDWHNTRNPRYSGGLQMDAVFWARYGGLAYASTPAQATRGEQIAVAQRGQAVQGWQAWPRCSKVIGVR